MTFDLPEMPTPKPDPYAKLREGLTPALLELFPLHRVDTIVSHTNTDDDNTVVMIRLAPDLSK